MDGPRPGVSDPELLRRRRALRDGRRELKLGAAERQLERDAERHRKEDPLAWLKDVGELENMIDWMLENRQKALAAESVEDREKRVSQYYNPHREETMRLLALVDVQSAPALPAPPESDAASPAVVDSSSDDQCRADGNSTAPIEVPAAFAGPARPDSAPPTRSDAPDTRVPAAASPSAAAASALPYLKARVRPVRTVAYDGSDESANDPRWERIG